MNISDKIAGWLHEKGINTAFGIVGGGNVTLWDAITRLQKTQIVCCHHEQAAVMAAGAFYIVSRRLSVALVTTGAGSTNAITGVVSAWMDSTPVLILSGNESSKYMYARTRTWGVQGFDSTYMVKECVKHPSGRMMNTRNFMDLLEQSYESALKPRQGPVWLDIPKDIQGAMV